MRSRSPLPRGIAIGLLVVACGRLGFERVTPDPDATLDGASDGAPTSGPPCPAAGYVEIPPLPHRYRELGQLDFEAAKTMCAGDGTVVATMDDALEVTVLLGRSMSGSAWAGIENVDGVWTTGIGTPASHLPWRPGEPSATGDGAVVEAYTDELFLSHADGSYAWFAFCECWP